MPVGCLYTPLKPLKNMPIVQYNPIRCNNSNCGAVLNPWCAVDLRSKLWTCPFCMTRNNFPPHYAENISETNLPAELMPDYTTIEYEFPNKQAGPPMFLFVVDTAISEEELDGLKDSLQEALTILPENALVGLITFGTMVQVHELGFGECPRAYVFRGNKDVPADKITALLGLRKPGQPGQPTQPGRAPNANPSQQPQPSSRFMLPVSECNLVLDSILEDLTKDPWPVSQEQRPQRCTGVALSIAVGMLEKIGARRGARIMMFVGGPPTVGPGAICDRSLANVMRSHTDIQKGRTPFLKDAEAHYQGLAKRCVNSCHVIDIFASSLDQIGLLEMKSCVDLTGGLVVLADSFGQSVFKESLTRVFTRHAEDALPNDVGHLTMAFAGTLECITSREYRVRGAIGPCSSLKKKSSSVSDNPLGQGGTYAWRIGGLTPATSIGLYFEVSA